MLKRFKNLVKKVELEASCMCYKPLIVYEITRTSDAYLIAIIQGISKQRGSQVYLPFYDITIFGDFQRILRHAGIVNFPISVA